MLRIPWAVFAIQFPAKETIVKPHLTPETQVHLQIELEGHFCNHWPLAKISVNDQVLYDGPVIDSSKHIYQVDVGKNNHLVIQHYGKRFGDDNIYDCRDDQSQDCVLEIKDIKFNNVSIGQELMSKLDFETQWTPAQLSNLTPEFLQDLSKINCANRTMNFNSLFKISFETPILNWLTIAKYKIEAKQHAYFSNYSLLWHYEEDLKLIEEIKSLIKQ
jgi:hypothetical protein